MKVGQRLPDLVRTITLTDMVAYGGATWDSHRLHYDPSFAVSAGMERPVVDGQMLGALFGEQLTRCLGKANGSAGCSFAIPHPPTPMRRWCARQR